LRLPLRTCAARGRLRWRTFRFLRPIALVLAVRVRRADSGLGQAGPASVTITLDRYGHLLPGDVDTTLAQFDAYLARALNA